MTTRTRLCHNKLFSDHLIESRVSGFPRDFCLAFGSLVRIWKQVGFNVGVGICSIFRNLKRSMSNINMMRKNIKKNSDQNHDCDYQVSDVHHHDEESTVPVGDGELHLSLHPTSRGAQWRFCK